MATENVGDKIREWVRAPGESGTSAHDILRDHGEDIAAALALFYGYAEEVGGAFQMALARRLGLIPGDDDGE